MEELEDEIKDFKNLIETLENSCIEKDDKIYDLENELKCLDEEFEKVKKLLEEQDIKSEKEKDKLIDDIIDLKIDLEKIKSKNRTLEFKNFFLNNKIYEIYSTKELEKRIRT